MLNAMAKNLLQFQQTTTSSIQNLERQVGQLSESMSRMEGARDPGKLSAQTEVNPKRNVNAIFLRRGNEVTTGMEAAEKAEE